MSWKAINRPSRGPSWLPSPLRWLLQWGLALAFVGLLIALFYLYLAGGFDISQVAKMPERSVIVDRHGEVFDYIHGERRRSIERDEIPEVMVFALRAREDLRFPDHSGIDLKGLMRATLRNIKDLSFTQGASTLTMQLARNSYELRAKSLHRKLLEMALTLRIEHHYSKDEILTHYLNRIYYGAGCHGVEEAAQTYFGRSTSELNTGECAMLVGIIRGPHVFSPFRNPEAAMRQRDEVLERMKKCGFINGAELAQIKNERVRLVSEGKRSRSSSYVKESIRKRLQVLLEKHDIRDGGLRIYTTLDGVLQHRCDRRIGEAIPVLEEPGEVGDLQAAVVRMDVRSGGILAVSGGRSYQRSAFNRAYLAKRDLGPAFTPFLNALALERGKVVIPGKPVQTGRQLGVEETTRLAKRLHFSGPFQRSEDLYRGAVAATPMELAVAAATLANRGERPDPHYILRIDDEQGRTLYRYHPSPHQALRADAATDGLETMTQKDGKRQVLAMTGSRRDAWVIELEKDAVLVGWLGYDQPKKIADRAPIKEAFDSLLGN